VVWWGGGCTGSALLAGREAAPHTWGRPASFVCCMWCRESAGVVSAVVATAAAAAAAAHAVLQLAQTLHSWTRCQVRDGCRGRDVILIKEHVVPQVNARTEQQAWQPPDLTMICFSATSACTQFIQSHPCSTYMLGSDPPLHSVPAPRWILPCGCASKHNQVPGRSRHLC
jgi:hypothetical protein